MQFFWAPNASNDGTWFTSYIGHELAEKVEARFFPTPNAYVDPERGYNGDEYRFVNEEGNLFCLYSRWGAWRLGGRGLTPGDVGDFVNWMKAL